MTKRLEDFHDVSKAIKSVLYIRGNYVNPLVMIKNGDA